MSLVGAGELMAPATAEITSEFKEEALRIVEACRSTGVVLRLLGALAFNIHCKKFGHLQELLGRALTDIDFASDGRYRDAIVKLMTSLDYKEDFMVSRLFGAGRILFHHNVNGRRCDVFLDKLEFSHDIPFNGRLEADYPTVPLAELLLEKMQIVKLNEKDVIDTIMLLREHKVGEADDETINAQRISFLCAQECGFWRTVTGNLKRIVDLAPGYEQLTEEDVADITGKVGDLLERIEDQPKTLSWKLRSRIGESRKWYRDVDEFVR
jgi:hypothetical protein